MSEALECWRADGLGRDKLKLEWWEGREKEQCIEVMMGGGSVKIVHQPSKCSRDYVLSRK